MSKLDPKDAVWYVEAKDAQGVLVSAGSAVAVRLKKSDGQSFAETYLLTCVHVVRRLVGNGPHYGDILSKLEGYRPGVGYNPAEAVQLTIVDEMIEKLPTDPGDAANDWVLLRINNGQTASASPAIDRWGGSSNCRVKICGYPGGTGSFVNSVVRPTETPDECSFESQDLGVLQFGGDGSRSGMSGGGVFEVGSQQFLGLHRAKRDSVLRLYAIAATYIFQRLGEMGYAVASTEPHKIGSEKSEVLSEGNVEIENRVQTQQDLVIDTIERLLEETKELKSNLVNTKVLSLPENAESQEIAQALLSQDRPIDTLRNIVRYWRDNPNKFTFSKNDACEFHAIMDILALHSLPIEDCNQVRSAMLRAKNQLQKRELSSPVKMPISASNKVAIDYTKTLLRQTWIILNEPGEKVVAMLQLLLDRKPSSQSDRFRLLNRVRILNEPPDSNDEEFLGGLTLERVAQHLINEIEGLVSPVEDPVSHLRDVILPDLYSWNDIVVMIVSNQRKLNEYLGFIKKEFPSVLCLCLSDVEANPYRAVTYTVNSILDNVPKAFLTV